MKLEYVKFFQAVQVQTVNGFETVTYLKSDKFNCEHVGALIKVDPIAGGPTTYVTLNNVCFMRALPNDDAKKKAARGTSQEA